MQALYPYDVDDPTPLIMPPRGKHYHQVWMDEERSLLPGSYAQSHATPLSGRGQSRDTTQNGQYCGSLTERILQALMDVEPPALSAMDIDTDDAPSAKTPVHRDISGDEIYDVELRIRRELKLLGLYDEPQASDSQQSGASSDDDEISLELRRLQ